MVSSLVKSKNKCIKEHYSQIFSDCIPKISKLIRFYNLIVRAISRVKLLRVIFLMPSNAKIFLHSNHKFYFSKISKFIG